MRTPVNIAVTVMVLAGSTLAAAPAYAGVVHPDLPVICDRNRTDLWFTTTSSAKTITHVRYISVPAGGSVDLTSNVTKIATITASVKFTSDTTVEAQQVIAKESEKVGVELAASGSVTYQGSETVAFHMVAGSYAVYAGEKKFSGQWAGTRCNTNGTHESSLSGSAVSFAVPGDGAASCDKNYPTSSFEYKAKTYGC